GIVDGVLIKERRNAPGACVGGVNLEGKIARGEEWQMQAGLTWHRSLYKEALAWADDVQASRQMLRTPDLYGYFVSSYSPVKPLTVSLSGTYTGPMLVEHHAGYIEKNRTERTPSFLEMNLKLAYDFRLYRNIILQVSTGIQNLLNAWQKDFDQGPDRDSGYIYGPTTPRTVFAGVKLGW
ncbi:MAG: TonB-dependent receptor, partial [Bacteroidales bacterium]|nr:TonB-dependent receptor [Bacteroidales bacterium]